MTQLKENYNERLEEYIIMSIPIIHAYDWIDKHENLLLQYGYPVIFDSNSFCGIVTPTYLVKKAQPRN